MKSPRLHLPNYSPYPLAIYNPHYLPPRYLNPAIPTLPLLVSKTNPFLP